MKKELFFLFLFLIFNKTYGQNTPDYAYLVKTKVVYGLHKNFGKVTITTNNGVEVASETYEGYHLINLGKTFYDVLALPNSFNTLIVKVNNYNIGAGSGGGSIDEDCFTEGDIHYIRNLSKTNFTYEPFRESCGFKQELYPLHIIDDLAIGDNNVCARNTLELSGGYDWQYYIGNNANPSDDQWKDYASAVTNISVNVGDLYAAEGISIIDFPPTAPQRSLKIRTGHKTSDKYVSPKTYQVSDCSPEFKGYYNKTKTTCVYKSDGRISLNLGRDIDTATNEKLVVTLFKKDLVHGNSLMGQSSIKTNLVNNGGSKYGFVWPSDIDTGKYYFKYQSLNKNSVLPNPLPHPSDNYWKSLVETPVFEIFPAENVNFIATKFSDETCVGAKNGKIKLDITSGETNRSYQYIIYEVNGTSVTLYRDWTTFTGRTTIIENLEKKTEYRIKVQDTEECFARKN